MELFDATALKPAGANTAEFTVTLLFSFMPPRCAALALANSSMSLAEKIPRPITVSSSQPLKFLVSTVLVAGPPMNTGPTCFKAQVTLADVPASFPSRKIFTTPVLCPVRSNCTAT